MNASKQAAWLFIALISLACSGWYFASTPATQKLDDKTLSTTVDTTIHQLTVYQYDAHGKLVNYLQTPLLRHIPQDNKHWLKTPHIIITQAKEPPWEIRSKQAISLHGGEKITFSKSVVIHQPKDGHTPESTLKTEEMIYFPKEKLAMTEKEVTYEQPGNIVQSTGMKAYLAEKRVQLLNRARGIYDPKHG
ncbi:LPS export ABC transporter periplasmic protein LptC [Legionella nagasakiensis]|uniref:LPS export ABC transporter periplasmic protein LptC n=1 Tax=Legionella nagasakiensis TaxID=535290 RepID=UPI001055190A|nr:LPS export ABC transporter periplasmic protein LptC [Legionella nagasakiensis]